ncbi:MAG: MFS transporter [Myxococcota bacterium]
MLAAIRKIFGPAPHKARLPDDEIRRHYPRLRWQVMEATFVGYGVFYIVRNNFAVVAKDVQEALHYSNTMVGNILAISAVSYGIGKFVMGAMSDRSNPRVFMAFGLLLTALVNFTFGSVQSYPVHLLLWSMNGFIQGMGWPPCGRSMGHWFSRRERGLTFSIWNTSHNVGGGLAGILAAWAVVTYGGWQYAFVVPGCIALVGAGYILWRLRDSPQSVGLCSIEEYKDDYPPTMKGTVERDLTFRELFIDNVLKNKWVWTLAFANFFAYIARYSMLDWGPMYLRDVKGASITGGGIAVLMIEFGGIPSTILFGWVSDRIGGRRGMVAVLCMIPIVFAFTTILLTPAGYLWLDMSMLAIVGLCIYPVINFIVIMALDLTSKKAIGTAAGFIGLFGYLGRMTQAKGFGGLLDHLQETHSVAYAWQAVLYLIVGCSLVAIFLLALTWKVKPKAPEELPEKIEDAEEKIAV